MEIVDNNIDIFMIAETKLDSSFPSEQFSVHGFSKPFRLDRNSNGGGLLVYVRDDIPSFQLKSFSFKDDIECICFEINDRRKKWALFCIYRPPSQEQTYFFDELGKAIDHYSEKYKNFILVGD